MDDKVIENLNPEGLEIDKEMLKEDIEIQEAGNEEELVQDEVEEVTPESLNEEGVEVENANEND